MSSDPFKNLPARIPPVPPAPYIVSGPPMPGHNRAEQPSDTLNLAFVLRSVRQWWRIALPLGLLLAAAGAAVVWTTFKPTYRTTAFLLINEQADYLAYKGDPSARFVQDQIELLRGPFALERVLAKPEIAHLPEIGEQSGPLEWLQKNITAKNDGGSDIYELSFAGSDPAHITTIINAVIDSYLELATQTTRGTNQSSCRVAHGGTGTPQKRCRALEAGCAEFNQTALRDRPIRTARQSRDRDPAFSAGRLARPFGKHRRGSCAAASPVDRPSKKPCRVPSQHPSDDVLEQLIEVQPEIAKFKEDHEKALQLWQKPSGCPGLDFSRTSSD